MCSALRAKNVADQGLSPLRLLVLVAAWVQFELELVRVLNTLPCINFKLLYTLKFLFSEILTFWDPVSLFLLLQFGLWIHAGPISRNPCC